MAWIESHQSLLNHPKRLDLSNLMQWSVPETIGRLNMFWWWCLDYAADGDLRKHNDGRIAGAMGVAIDDSKRLVEAMVQACWLEREPYFRVRSWWDYVGRFLQTKYRQREGEWRKIKELYIKDTAPVMTTAVSKTMQPNQPNQPNQPSTVHFVNEIYEAYPRKVGKPRALDAIKKALQKLDGESLLQRTRQYAAAVATKERRFIPHPATWFGQERFNDLDVEWHPDDQKPRDTLLDKRIREIERL